MTCNQTTNKKKEGKQLELHADKQTNNQISKKSHFQDMFFEM